MKQTIQNNNYKNGLKKNLIISKNQFVKIEDRFNFRILCSKKNNVCKLNDLICKK